MPTTQWGRKETIIWPPRSPIYSYGAVFLSIVAVGLFVYLRFSFALAPLEQFYLPYYLRTGVAEMMHKTDKYQLLTVADGQNHARLATEDDVEEGTTPDAGGSIFHSNFRRRRGPRVFDFCIVDRRFRTSTGR